MKARETGRQHAVVGHSRFRENDGSGFAQTGGGRRVRGGGREIGGRRAERRWLAFRGEIVLNRCRDAVERSDRLAAHPARFRRFGVIERAVGTEKISRFDMRFETLDALKHVLHRFERRKRTRLIGGEEIHGREFMRSHGAKPSSITRCGALDVPFLVVGAQSVVALCILTLRKHRRVASAARRRFAPYCFQDIAERSFTKIGESFHSPCKFAFSTLIC
jgi:hypothetical protein